MLFVASLSAIGQDSALYRACNQKARTQAEMNACANQEGARADAERNRLYDRLRAAAADQPEASAKIKAAENAWLGYRDAYLEEMYPAADKQGAYGSIYPMEAEMLRAKLTRHHTAELKDVLQRYKGGSE
jgi:uncharacterized protein YecT (DUF1311 family)